jgi:hypothetical protein
MGTNYNGRYNSVSEITGPSGWYTINTAAGPCQTYINQSYDGGGWCLVLANRQNTGGMNNLTYVDATTKSNFRTGGSSQGANTVVPEGSKLSSLADYNVFIAPLFWPMLAGRASSGKVTVVQFVSGTNGTALNATGSHNKRYRWRFDSFNSRWGFVGATGISDETATGSPGMLNYHAANGFSLTTYDVDQDTNGGNCATYYNNNPFWYGSCWSGNWFAGNGYADAPYWDSSGSDYWQYGAVYIK